MQSRPHHLGYAGVKATGYFGPVTENAVTKFQSTHHLVVDGVVGSRTARVLQWAAQSPGSAASPIFLAPPPRTYRVRWGDTLSEIARRFHTSWRRLAALNHLTDPSQLRAGRLLILRAGAPRIVRAFRRASLSLRRRVIATALRYRGVPYVWGGESPHGFDCSGLVQYVLAENGIHIGRTTWDQYRAVRHISRSRLAPGDLVFFRTYAPGASHVGIYLGEDQGLRQAFIDAPAPGQRVKIQNLDTPFWRHHYYGAGVVRR